MKKIKVAIIITKLELGGAQKVALSLYKKLDNKIFEPILICGCGGILDDTVKNDTNIYFVKNLIRQINPIKDIKAFIEIYKILKKENPDIIHTHSSKAGVLGRLVAKVCGIKNVVHTIHGFSFSDNQNILTKNLYVFLEKFCAKFTKYLIPVSNENTKKGLKYNIGTIEQYHFIRLGIDIDNFKKYSNNLTLRNELNLKSSDIVITTIGPFKPQKNLTDFIKLANICLKENKNLYFVIVGDGILRPELENLISKLNISNKVKLLGWRYDISNILHSSNLFVMTSLWEGLPISTIESMASGIVPIVNDVDGQREIIKHGYNGFLITPKDLNTMKDKIMLLLNDKQLNTTLSNNAQNTIDKTYSIDYMIKKHEELYLKIINEINK